MKRKRLREIKNLLLPLLAALAVIIGAVKLWDLPADKIYDALIAGLILVTAMALSAFVVVLVIKSLQKWLKK